MYVAKHFKNRMNAQPFRPFRIHMSDGAAYEVQNHKAALVTKDWIKVGLEFDHYQIPRRTAMCSILNITQVEDLQPAR